jgi:hypothetical protein
MDNFFQNCPPKMNDARHITDYQSATRRNEYIKYINDIWRDDQYRLFLQLNGKEIMDREWKYDKKYYSCWVNDCIHHYPTRSLPRHFWQEREAFDSIYNMNTHELFEPLRRCTKYKDYRMTSDKC